MGVDRQTALTSTEKSKLQTAETTVEKNRLEDLNSSSEFQGSIKVAELTRTRKTKKFLNGRLVVSP